MRLEIRTLMWLIVLTSLTCGSPAVEAQSAGVTVVVNDVDGKPIGGANVTVRNPNDENFEETKVTSRKGKVKFSHSDSQPTYSYEIQKDGYQTVTATAHSEYHETARLEVVLLPEKTGQVSGQDLQTALSQSRAYEIFNQGVEAQEQGDLELAAEKFQQAAEINPRLPEPHIALAVVAHQREDYVTAVAEAELALTIDPSNEQALLLKYDGYRMLGDAAKTTEAAEALRGTGAVSAATSSVFNEGLEEYKAGRNDLAVTRFRQAIELDPELAVGYVMLGSIAMSRQDIDQAIAMASKAVEIDPGDANGYKVLYDALRNSGDADGAKQALDSLIKIDPEWVATGLFNHAAELYDDGQMEDAAVALARVVELQPDDAKALFLLGMAQYNLGKIDDAKVHLNKFLELAPDDPDAAIAREMLQYSSQ